MPEDRVIIERIEWMFNTYKYSYSLKKKKIETNLKHTCGEFNDITKNISTHVIIIYYHICSTHVKYLSAMHLRVVCVPPIII